MMLRQFSPTSSNKSRSGYTLLEILVALSLGSLVAALATSGYVLANRAWQGQRERIQTEQSLRTAVDVLSREVRLAGAGDLPNPLDGTNSGLADTIMIRTNLRRATGTPMGGVAAGATSLNLDNVANFVAGMTVQIFDVAAATSEVLLVASVDQAASRLDLDPSTPTALNYPDPSSVRVDGYEAQTFSIDGTGAVPMLNVAPALGVAQPVVAGIERLNIRYVLSRNCVPGPCDVVDLPASGAEWAIVRMIEIDIGARSGRPVPGQVAGLYRIGQVVQIKPRNFLF